jgi:hypothetical protein
MARILTSLHGNRVGLSAKDDLVLGTRIAATKNGVVTSTAATLTLTPDLHAQRVLVATRAAGQAFTLPAATGTGDVYTIVLGATITSNTTTIKVANATDIIQGLLSGQDATTAGLAKAWATAGTSDTISLNGTTTGGKIGDRIIITDIASGVFQVSGLVAQSGTVATPFSATVS